MWMKLQLLNHTRHKKKTACRPRLPKNLLTKVETFSIILHKRPSEPQSKQNFTFEVGVSKIEHSRGGNDANQLKNTF